MNNQQKLLILAAIAGVSAVGLLILLNRRRNAEDFDDDGGQELREFPDLTAGENTASASDTVLQLNVPHYCVGSIIGKGGENIRQLKKETGARLDFEREPEESNQGQKKDRILEIRGEREKVHHAEARIKKIIAETPPIVSEEVSVPQSAVGRIIGRMGQTIRELSRASGARIVVPRTEDRSGNGTQKIMVTGTSQQIEYAKGLIEEKVEEDKVSRRTRVQEYVTGKRGRSPSPAFRPKLSTVQLPKTEGFFPLFVSAFDIPGHFYIQLVTKESSKLDDLTKEITDFFWNRNNTEGQRSLDKVCVGDMVCAPFEYDNLWYRATVVEVDEQAKRATLYYIDYGDTGEVAFENLKRPEPEHLELEAQAIECLLANVEPKDGKWTEESIDRFEDLSYCAKWTQLMGRLVGTDDTDGGRLPCLELVDTNLAEEVNIGEQLIKEGFAVKSESPQASQGSQLTAITEGVASENSNNNTPDVTSATKFLPEVNEVLSGGSSIEADKVKNSSIITEDFSYDNVVLDESAVSTEFPPENDISTYNENTVELLPDGGDNEEPVSDNHLNRNSLTSLSSVSTEDTVIHVVDKYGVEPPVGEEGSHDLSQEKAQRRVETENKKSHDLEDKPMKQAVVLPNLANAVNVVPPETKVKESESQRSGESGQGSKDLSSVDATFAKVDAEVAKVTKVDAENKDFSQESQTEEEDNLEVEGQDLKDSGVDLDIASLDSNSQRAVNDEVTRWMERSLEGSTQLETISEDLPLNEGVKSNLQSTELESSTRSKDGKPYKFLDSMEMAKENPIILSDDEDSMSYFSARSELTIADTDTDTMSYKSAPDTPTNNSEFEFPSRGDSMIDYDVITTPVGSDDENLIPDIDATPVARTSSPKVTITSRTPKYQIRVIDESKDKNQSPKAVSSSMDNITPVDASTLGSSPQRIGNLSASMPQFGGLKTSQARFGGSGNLQGKETSI